MAYLRSSRSAIGSCRCHSEQHQWVWCSAGPQPECCPGWTHSPQPSPHLLPGMLPHCLAKTQYVYIPTHCALLALVQQHKVYCYTDSWHVFVPYARNTHAGMYQAPQVSQTLAVKANWSDHLHCIQKVHCLETSDSRRFWIAKRVQPSQPDVTCSARTDQTVWREAPLLAHCWCHHSNWAARLINPLGHHSSKVLSRTVC